MSYQLSPQDDSDFDTPSITPSVSTATLPVQTNHPTKKRKKTEDDSPRKIDEKNVSRFKVLKKLNIQRTRTEHHINYLQKCITTKSVPRALRVNLTPQVPVISSTLQIKWEEAHIEFGNKLCEILLQYWENRHTQLQQEIEIISKDLKEITSPEQIELITDIISSITINVERELRSKKQPTNTKTQPDQQ
jgi:hypothetical protein